MRTAPISSTARRCVRLEIYLLDSVEARRIFADYFQHHTEIHFAVRARRAADAVMEQLADWPDKPRAGGGINGARRKGRGSQRHWRPRLRHWVFAATLMIAVGVCCWMAFMVPHHGPGIPARAATANVAWLVNAQNCTWRGPTSSRAGTCKRASRSDWSEVWQRSNLIAAHASSSRDQPALSSSPGVRRAPERHPDGAGAGACSWVHRPHSTQQSGQPGDRVRPGG